MKQTQTQSHRGMPGPSMPKASQKRIIDMEDAKEGNARRRTQPKQEGTQERQELHQWKVERFGLRWDPRNDLLDVPDTSGVYVLFFDNEQTLVGMADNLFRRLRQCRFSPGRSFHAFSWMEVVPHDARIFALRMLTPRSYAQLWEEIRPGNPDQDG